MISALLALALAAPQPIRPDEWIGPNDYPSDALRENRSGHTAFRLTISPSGRPIRCDVTASSGWEDIDQQSCRGMMKRARFKPILDGNGAPAYAVYRSSRSFWIPGEAPPRTPKPSRTDLLVTVEKMPKGRAQPADVDVAFTVDGNGAMADCTPYLTDTAGQTADAPRAMALFGAVACGELAKSYRPTPALDEGGRPVPSVQTARVSFVQAAE
ncbi:hypothetical protein COO09_24520 [Rhizorhabdus dicambivorans]|uniref:TonB C-terminal domain-containing protein n=2 Tax=Rhizorhabdus dicambivorans TaxID=1850238 RepID=A0A2A4FPM9_9SPHN|nr:hypothetical protein CMV14_20450 [Rhizorhabdus dicambivorans]PCE39636.1 hypothetical protein COO09_24520 [Rhizorhabdus dicambivorans]